MAARKTSSKNTGQGSDQDRDQQQVDELPAPPFWIATHPLNIGGEGAMPVRAYNPGDRVGADVVEANGWQGFVERPEGDWTPPELVPPEVGAAPAEDQAQAQADSDQAGAEPASDDGSE